MNLDKLGKTLAKEFKRSPGKSLVLIGLIPVALYYWAPLISKTWRAKSPPTAHTAVPQNDGAAAITPVVATPATPNVETWETMVERMSRDRNRLAVSREELPERNPFAPPAKPITSLAIAVELESSDEPIVAPTTIELAEFDPTKLQLELQATLVGGRVRSATINGRKFREGQRLRFDGAPVRETDPPSPDETLTIVAIRPTTVVLEHPQKTFELTIKTLRLTGDDQVQARATP